MRRDEAAAAAREEAEEQRMQEEDAERRMRILRGLPVDELPEDDSTRNPSITKVAGSAEPRYEDAQVTRDEDAHTSLPAPAAPLPASGRERKRRHVAGEDDTDRDMRYAVEDRAAMHEQIQRAPLVKSKASDAPVVDRRGHIDLFPAEARKEAKDEEQKKRQKGQKDRNPERQAEEERKKREYEDQYTMRFSNAAGFKQAVDERPWYYGSRGEDGERQDEGPTVGKDVWGNEDPKRRERERGRMVSDDPLAAIRRGVQGVRKAEKDRKEWKEQRIAEVDGSVGVERRERKRHRRHRYHYRSDEDDLESFSLDVPGSRERKPKHEHRHRHSHHGDGRERRERHRRPASQDRAKSSFRREQGPS